MKIALICPWNPKETAIAQNQIAYFRCMCDYTDIDFFSDKTVEVEVISIKKLDLDTIKKYDVLHFQWGNNPLHFFEYSFMKKLKFLGMKFPTVSTIHEVDLQYMIGAHKNGWLSRYHLAMKYFTSFYKEILKNRMIPDILTTIDIVNNSDVTIVNSDYAKNRMLQEFSGFDLDSEKIVTARLGVDLQKFEISKEEAEKKVGIKLPEDKIIFLYVGFLHKIKSIDLVLKAFYFIDKFAKRDDFFFLVIGDGPDKSRLQRLANKRIPKNSAFMGFVEDIIPYYKMADIVINPRTFSRGEASATIPEAFSAGKSMIAPNLGCNHEYITNERGYLTENNDELDYMDAILYFLEHPDEISKRGANAKEFAMKSLDWRSQAKTFIKQYEKAVELHGNNKDYSKVRKKIFELVEATCHLFLYAGIQLKSRFKTTTMLDYEPVNPKILSNLESKVFMGENELVQLGTGWNNLEIWPPAVRWTNGHGIIYMPNIKTDRILEINVTGPPFETDINIFVDKKKQYSGKIENEWQNIRVKLQKNVSNNNYLSVEIVSPSWQASKILRSSDRRKLGVAVKRISIKSESKIYNGVFE